MRTAALCGKRGRRNAGDFVDLRAGMDLSVIASNAGYPLDPALAATPGPIDLMRFTAPPRYASDICQTSSLKAQRAFALTERHTGYFRSLAQRSHPGACALVACAAVRAKQGVNFEWESTAGLPLGGLNSHNSLPVTQTSPTFTQERLIRQYN